MFIKVKKELSKQTFTFRAREFLKNETGIMIEKNNILTRVLTYNVTIFKQIVIQLQILQDLELLLVVIDIHVKCYLTIIEERSKPAILIVSTLDEHVHKVPINLIDWKLRQCFIRYI